MKRGQRYVTATILLLLAISLLTFNFLPTTPPARVAGLIERVENAKQTIPVSAPNSVARRSPTQAASDDLVAYSTPLTHDQAVIAASLEGTDIDGALQADAAGNLILNLGVRDFFDYFLSTADELGAEASIDEIVRYVQAYLPAKAQNQALDLLENYLHYKQFEFDLQQTPITNPSMTDADTLAIMAESYAQLKAERASRFSMDANQALFGLEDQYAEFTLRTLEVGADSLLSAEQKANKTDQLLNSLPTELAGDARQQRAQETQQETLQAALASSQDDSQIYDLLAAQGYPRDEADNVIQYRQQQRDFDSRYQQYRAMLEPKDSAAAQAPVDQARLKQRFFSTPEEQTQASLRDLRQDADTEN